MVSELHFRIEKFFAHQNAGLSTTGFKRMHKIANALPDLRDGAWPLNMRAMLNKEQNLGKCSHFGF